MSCNTFHKVWKLRSHVCCLFPPSLSLLFAAKPCNLFFFFNMAMFCLYNYMVFSILNYIYFVCLSLSVCLCVCMHTHANVPVCQAGHWRSKDIVARVSFSLPPCRFRVSNLGHQAGCKSFFLRSQFVDNTFIYLCIYLWN